MASAKIHFANSSPDVAVIKFIPHSFIQCHPSSSPLTDTFRMVSELLEEDSTTSTQA
jgi:hypothetical protein